MSIPKPLAFLFFTLPWVLMVFFIGWLVVQRYPRTGIFTVQTTLDGHSSWIQPFLPAQRVTNPGLQSDGWTGQRILDEPVYFTAATPGPYDSVDVSLEFRSVRQPLIEFGLVHDDAGLNLEMKPLYSSQLESSSFTPVQSTHVQGFVAPDVSASRLSDSNPRGLMTWDTTTTSPLLSDPANPETQTTVSLRGADDFYLVPAGGALHMTFVLQAANRITGGDIAAFRIFRGDTEITQQAFSANGNRDTRMGTTFEHSVDIQQAEPGVYRISFLASDDVFIRAIKTTSQHWVVGPRLVFGDEVGYSTSTPPAMAWSSSRHIVTETFHTEGLQQAQFGTVKIPLRRTHVLYRLDRTSDDQGLGQFYAPKGDIRLVGDGFFALRQDAFFEPKPHRLTDGTDLVAEHVQAVLTPYVHPEALGDGWYRATETYDLDARRDRLRFVLSVPGVAERDAAVDIRNIQLTYHRSALTWSDWWQTLRQEAANAWHRL